MIVLAVDTAGAACSVALWRDGATLALRSEALRHGHAERLLPMVQQVLAEAGLGFAALDLFAVTTGPGAFTGLRIGLAAVGGMALACDRPIVGIGSFAAVAAGVDPAERAGHTLLVALDSRRAELFVQLFDAVPAPLGPPACLAPAALSALLPAGPVLVAGNAATPALAALAGRPGLRQAGGATEADPAAVAALADARAAEARRDPPAPVYLRPPDAAPAPPPRPIVP